jgi:hypothetical protein
LHDSGNPVHPISAGSVWERRGFQRLRSGMKGITYYNDALWGMPQYSNRNTALVVNMQYLSHCR